MIHFMKNLSMMGAMLFVVANGSGPMSLDSRLQRRTNVSVENVPAGKRTTPSHASVA
jgi:hypothetical protein